MTRVVSLFLPTLSTDRVRRKSGGAAPPGEAPLVLVGRVDGLRVLGFDRVADLLGQPRAPLALRFGPELGRRIDQAIGRLSEPIETIRPAALIEVRRVSAEPIGAADTIARYIAKLASQLCDALEAKGLGARRLDLICHRVDNRAQAVRVGTALPLRDPKRMTSGR
jgi:protein ImuB